MLRRRGIQTWASAGLAAIALVAVAVPASIGSEQGRRATKTVTVADDFFAPTDLKVKKKSSVKWVWDSSNTNTHNVILTSKHPKDVKASDFRSSSGAVGISFKRKFKVPGKYGFICTYHRSEMKFGLTVKK